MFDTSRFEPSHGQAGMRLPHDALGLDVDGALELHWDRSVGSPATRTAFPLGRGDTSWAGGRSLTWPTDTRPADPWPTDTRPADPWPTDTEASHGERGTGDRTTAVDGTRDGTTGVHRTWVHRTWVHGTAVHSTAVHSTGLGTPDADPDPAAALWRTSGPGLAALLAEVSIADVADHVLVEMVAASSRLAAWSSAVQASAAGELAARRRWSSEREHLADELAATVGHAPNVGRTVVARGLASEDLPEVRSALASGVIDAAKADALFFTGVFADPEDRRAATVRVLPDAPRLGLRRLRTRMLAEAVRLSPRAVEANRKAAAAERYVRLEAVENSMAYLSAYLPAADAAALWAVVDDAGHRISRAAGEERTLAQARADALVALGTGGDVLPADEPSTSSDATPTTLTTPCSSCGATVSGTGYSLRVLPVRPRVQVTVPASTLLGLTEAPGHLAGYGPIPAEVARALAEDATWQRLLTDPTTGILTEYSSTTYSPGRVLRGAVEARDGTCTFPFCEQPAERCDLDHIQPFDPVDSHHRDEQPGQTRAANLHPLCRRHHRAKTHGSWTVTRDDTSGTITWTSPSGRSFTRPAHVVDPAHDAVPDPPDPPERVSARARQDGEPPPF